MAFLCNINLILEQDTPNEGREKINENFLCLGTGTATGITQSTFTNLTPTPTTIGGIISGSTFSLQTLQEMFDALLYPSITPNFSAFALNVTSPLIVGEPINGTKTFTWKTANNADIQANSIDITDTTNSNILASSLADDGGENVLFSPAITKTSPSSNTWTISGQDVDGNYFYKTYTLDWYWQVFYGESISATLSSAQIISLSSVTTNSADRSYDFDNSGDFKYICIPSSFPSPTSFKNSFSHEELELAGPDEGYTEFLDGFYYKTVSVTNAFSQTTNYRVYRTKRITIAIGIDLTTTWHTSQNLQSVVNRGGVVYGNIGINGTMSATTIFSGAIDLSSLINTVASGYQTYVQPGTNIITGGTPFSPIIHVNTNSVFTSISATTLSGGTIFSGNVDVSTYFNNTNTLISFGLNQIRQNYLPLSGGTMSGTLLAPSISAITLSGGTILSGDTDLSVILANLSSGGPSTYVQDGVNTYTGGTASNPTVNVVDSPTFTGTVTANVLGAVTISGGTIFSGNSELSTLIGGNQNLQSVTDVGNITTNNIVINRDNLTSLFSNKLIFSVPDGTGAGPYDAYVGFDLFTDTLGATLSLNNPNQDAFGSAGIKIGRPLIAWTYTGDTSEATLIYQYNGIGFFNINAATQSSYELAKIGFAQSSGAGEFGFMSFINRDYSTFNVTVTSLITPNYGERHNILTFPNQTGTIALLEDLTGGTSTYVQDGVNTYTGGTTSSPTVNVVDSPIFSGVITANALSAITISGGTILSGDTDLSFLINNNSNIANDQFLSITGGTGGPYDFTGQTNITGDLYLTEPSHFQSRVLFLDGANKVSTDDLFIFSSNTLLAPFTSFGQIKLETSYSSSGNIIYRNEFGTLRNGDFFLFDELSLGVSAFRLSGDTILSGDTDLSIILSSLSGGGPSTYLQDGQGTVTGGTANHPYVSLVGSPTFSGTVTSNALSATTLSGGTISSGGTELSQIFAPVTTTINTQTSNYTLALADLNGFLRMSSSTANQVLLPTNGSIPFLIGSQISIVQYGTGETSVSGATGVSLNSYGNSRRLSGQYASATAIKVGTDEWFLAGNIY